MTYQLLQGDCIEVLKTLPAGCVHTCVTSPPYFGLRDYGVAGQIGMESTVSEYVDKMVQVFRGVRRVLRDDGTVWLNLGDSYAGSWGNYGGQNRGNGSQRGITNGSQAHQKAYDGLEAWRPPTTNPGDGLKPKDLIGIPWRVAFALQADGWWLRSDIIWAKPNPMPESVTDRPTKAHEYLFLLAKSERYYYDSEAIKEPSVTDDMRRPYGSEGAWQLDGRPAEQRHGGELRVSRSKTFARNNAVSEHVLPGQSAAQHRPDRTDVIDSPTRNKRSVWTVATRPYKEAHFATYPVELIQPCILAGTSSHGCCAACGAPWIRTLERTKAAYTPCNGAYTEQHIQQSKGKTRSQAGGTPIDDVVTVGWGPSCNCMSADTYACTVLDPFNGSGTTGAVAINLGRQYIGIDINPDYIELAHKRIGNTQPALLGGAL